MIDRRDSQIGPAHTPTGQPQPLEGLGRGDLVDQGKVDVEQARPPVPLMAEVGVPEFVEESASHRPFKFGVSFRVPRWRYSAHRRGPWFFRTGNGERGTGNVLRLSPSLPLLRPRHHPPQLPPYHFDLVVGIGL